jgi:hypothetical protein
MPDEGGRMSSSKSVVEAIDRLRDSQGIGGEYSYPEIKNGRFENVLAFNNDEHIHLVEDDKGLHFSSEGKLTDLQHRPIPGSAVQTTFPVQQKDFDGAPKWPDEQTKPWNGPPLNNKNTTANGYSKQTYFFNNTRPIEFEDLAKTTWESIADYYQDCFVTVGPSLPKITPLSKGGAQFWVGSIGVVTQGIGEYKEVHGVSVYIGSAYLPKWPVDQKDQIEILKKGFDARVGTYFKFVK